MSDRTQPLAAGSELSKGLGISAWLSWFMDTPEEGHDCAGHDEEQAAGKEHDAIQK